MKDNVLRDLVIANLKNTSQRTPDQTKRFLNNVYNTHISTFYLN